MILPSKTAQVEARSARTIGLYAAIVALAVGTRLPFLFSADCINSDACIVPLMARHFARGELTPYFWGQRYMAAFEPLLLTPLAPFGLATASASVAVALSIALVQLYQVTRLARHVGAPPALAALLFALQAAVPASHQMALWGARHVATCLGLWALDRTLTGALRSRRGALGTGLILGSAFFGDHLTLVFFVPVLYVAWRERTQRRLLAGALPLVLLDIVLATTSAAGRHSLPQDPRDWLRGIRLLSSSALPRLFGLEWLDPVLAVRAGPLWIACSMAGVAALAWFAVLAFRELRRPEPALLGGKLLAVCVALLGAFHVIGALDEESVRYLLLGLGPLAVLFAWLAAKRGARLGTLLVTCLLLPRLPSLFHLYAAYAGRGAACRAELREMVQAVNRSRARAVFADYWDAYRLALASDERWPIGIPLRANRHPCWNHWARAETPVLYIAPSEQHHLYEKVTRAAPGAVWNALGRRRLTLLEHALPTLDGPEPREPPPGCAR